MDTACWYIVLLVITAVMSVVEAQEEMTCYSPGSLATAVILTCICTVLLLLAINYWWKKYRKQKDNHLILQTDPEKGKGEYAFDNAGFKDTSVLSANEKPTKSKWTHWSPFTGLTAKPEKRKTLDDSALENHQVKVVALHSHDFTGLGFNICGNMKEGIYIKDILHRGPAFESGKLSSGDRINSVTISFEHMVYEDALTILSYASPYEVIIEAKAGKLLANTQGQGAQPSHPVYRSSSCADLQYVDKSSKKRLFDDHSGSLSGSNSSSLQKSKTSTAALQKTPQKHMTPEQLRTQLEERIGSDHENNLKVKEKQQKSGTDSPIKPESETTTSISNKHQRFGVKVLPMMESNNQQLSPKITEQNQNNINIEKHTPEPIRSIDEVDESKKPQAKKREKKLEPASENANFERANEQQRSLIKRDENGIPQEIPNFMFNAALAAKNNRKNSNEDKEPSKKDEEDVKTPKKLKGKAPSPPDDINVKQTLNNNEETLTNKFENYDSDTDMINNSNNTIELNSSDITIHHNIVQEDEEKRQNDRKTASTGDLSKIQRAPRSGNTGTLERAQSLDITAEMDTGGMSGLSTKEEMASDEDLFGTAVLSKEPRLSLILDGLDTFQRNKLKKSREWGNLEDAILKLNEEENYEPFPSSNKSEYDALVDKINEIKREKVETIPQEVIDKHAVTAKNSLEAKEKNVKNQIWPTEDGVSELQIFAKCKNKKGKSKIPIDDDRVKKRQQIQVQTLEEDTPQSSLLKESSFQPIFSEKIGRQRDPGDHLTATILPPDHLERNLEVTTNKPISEEVKIEPKIGRQRMPEEEKIRKIPLDHLEQYTFEPISSVLKTEITTSQQTSPEDPLDSSPDDWDIVTTDINSTSPPVSLTLADEQPDENQQKSSEYLLSKIPGLSLNTTDESKTVVVYPPRQKNIQKSTQNFLFTEQMSCSQDKIYDTNVSDDIKVSRHQESPRHLESSRSIESSKIPELSNMHLDSSRSIEIPRPLETSRNIESSRIPEPSIKLLESSRILETPRQLENSRGTESSRIPEPTNKLLDSSRVLETSRRLESARSQDSSINVEPSTHLTSSRSLESSRLLEGSINHEIPKCDDAKSQDISNVSNVTITENPHHSLEWSINDTSDLYTTAIENTPSKVTVSTPDLIKNVTLTEAITAANDESPTNKSENSSLTYITEIQVTPNSRAEANVSEIEIVPNGTRNLETEFENYVKNFEEKLQRFENNIETFETDLSQFIQEEPTSIIINDNVEEEVHKIQEIAEEQLKKLPEMRFTTSSYESEVRPPEKRHSFEQLRSNFEKTTPKKDAATPTKSRIPIAMSSITTKTPPTSPERRDSRNLENEQDTAAILELMSSNNVAHSTPFSNSKIKPPSAVSKNVTVTSIRSNSKIPSGLPTFISGAAAGRPPIPPRRAENDEHHVVHVSTNGNANESSFKQWVFNPANVTNVTVENSNVKDK